MSLGHHKWVQQLHGTVICEYCGEFNSSKASIFCHKHPSQPENFMRAELHRQRLVIQSHDCGYGETGPGLIFCPIDKPCTKHRLERAEEEIARLTNKGSV